MGPGFESLKVHHKKNATFKVAFFCGPCPFRDYSEPEGFARREEKDLLARGFRRSGARGARAEVVPSPIVQRVAFFMWSFRDKNADLKTSINLSLSCPCSNDTADPAARGRLYHASFGMRTTIVQQQSKSLCRYAFYLFQFGNFDLHIRIGIAAARVEITELLVRKAALILARNGEFP